MPLIFFSSPHCPCQLCSNFLVLCRFHCRPASTIATLELLLNQHSANSKFRTRRLAVTTTRMGIARHTMKERAYWCKSEPEDRCVHDEGREQYPYVAFFFAFPHSLSYIFLFAPSPRNYLTFSSDPVFDWQTFKTLPEMICPP
jgi:hypothetical protein